MCRALSTYGAIEYDNGYFRQSNNYIHKNPMDLYVISPLPMFEVDELVYDSAFKNVYRYHKGIPIEYHMHLFKVIATTSDNYSLPRIVSIFINIY